MGERMTDETADVALYRERAREWLAANLERRAAGSSVPLARGHTTVESVETQRPIQRAMFDAGYAGISWPAEYGGQGLSSAHERAFIEEAQAFHTPDFGVLAGTTFGICAKTMLEHASPEFLRRHIPALLRGDELWVQFFSEPSAGSDLAGVTTRATRDGDRWALNGAKIWSSGAYYADYGMCLARTDWDVPKHQGLTWFAVRTDAPGVTIRPIREINGGTEFCEEFFDDVELTDDDVIGEVNRGWAVAQTMLVHERGGGSLSVLPSPGERRLAPDLVALARRAGREKDPNVRQLIARAHVNDYAAAQLSRRISGRMRASQGMEAGLASYGKLAMGTFLPLRARIGLEIGRGTAVLWEQGDEEPAAVSYLNGRVMSIAGGTNEVQRNAIGERVLGLPREPSFDTNRPFNEVLRNARNWTGKVG
jgi:alkylation response protein AidB-like acyl-CoA dehydrogenase